MNGNSPFLQQIFVPDTHHRFAVDRLGEAHLSSKMVRYSSFCFINVFISDRSCGLIRRHAQVFSEIAAATLIAVCGLKKSYRIVLRGERIIRNQMYVHRHSPSFYLSNSNVKRRQRL